MKRRDVCRLLPEPEEGPLPYVLILQTQRTSHLATVLVAPVARATARKITEETELPLEIGGSAFALVLHEIATVRRRLLGAVLFNAEPLSWRIGLALDPLLFGA